MELAVEIPDKFFINLPPKRMALQLKLNTAIELYRMGEISSGAACEFSGVDRIEFLVECRKRGIERRTYESEEELENEVESLRSLLK